MPNTLAHIGAQLPVTRAVSSKVDPRWVALGLLIPDLPWIFQRLIHLVFPQAPAIDIRAYVVVMSTPIFCMLLSAGISLLVKNSALVFAILAVESLLHEFLDCFQEKGGVGVPLLGPINWTSFSWPAFPMDGWISNLLTLSGALVILLLLLGKWKYPTTIRPARTGWQWRAPVVILFLASYIIGPMAFKEAAIRGNVHDLAVWRGDLPRMGMQIHFDRANYVPGSKPGESGITDNFNEDPIRIIGIQEEQPSLISTIATFSDEETLIADDYVVHPPGRRFWYTITGLIGVGLIWLIPLFRPGHGPKITR